MLFKSFSIGDEILPMGLCLGVDCGTYVCNEPTADQPATLAISRKENEASTKKGTPSPPTT